MASDLLIAELLYHWSGAKIGLSKSDKKILLGLQSGTLLLLAASLVKSLLIGAACGLSFFGAKQISSLEKAIPIIPMGLATLAIDIIAKNFGN